MQIEARGGVCSGGIAVFPTYSMINHNCLCNSRTKKLGLSNGHAMEVLAAVKIAKGEEITTRYTTPQWGTFRRQQLTQNYWNFTCRCARCVDPTEMGSMLNAVVCQKCLKDDDSYGFILPSDPTSLKSEWICAKCSEATAASEVNEMLIKFELELEKARYVAKMGYT